MMPHNLFQLQLMETFSNARHVAVRTGVSVLLAVPFIFVGMPPAVKAAGIVMVVLFTTFFGSAIGHAHLCEDNRFSRLMLLPISRPGMWLDVILASAVARLVPTLVVVIGFALFNGFRFSGAAILHLTGMLCTAVLLLTLLGTLTGHLARSNAEVHLYSALVCALVAVFAGVTPGIPKLTPLTNALAANPLRRLLSGLVSLTDGTMTLTASETLVSSVLLALFGLAVIWRWLSGRKTFPL